ncbi:membrane-bound lytic murein transglycosylase MltF [Marinobacterium jannaschii]|uniref:membrane-bound lytic murein transglycosylase MltF n=1 Tax=Marinobacterium jannaschii TaxID=64970 RepID=UPI000AB8D76A|nr:membrane-bound lytic murein transglycosylase MltF [Marinobacterium jannaschii]
MKLFDLRKKKDLFHLLAMVALLCIPAILSYNSKTQLQVIRESGTLRVVTTNTHSTYFIERDKPAGFEYELVQAFADHLGVEAKFEIASNVGDVMETIQRRDAHLAAAMLTVTADRLRRFDFAPPYMYSASTVVYRITRGKEPPRSVQDMIGREVRIVANSSYEESLRRLQDQYPELSWQSSEEEATVELMEAVHQRKLDLTVLDEVSFNAQKSFFPGLNSGFTLDESQPLAWMLPPHPDESLKRALVRFFLRTETQTLIKNLKEKYFARRNQLDYFDTVTFKKDMKKRLPKLEQYFHMAEQETDIDWKLLAAIAYQESHWNPKAVSPTGVRGVMMLTRATAKEMGVKDRTDPRQSIMGGAHYLIKVMSKIPKRITGKDRFWMALAGYNVGFGHLEDARILASRAGENPDRWETVKKFLPLLTKPKYYKTVKRGYARGYEPVAYVRNIRKYIALLRWELQVNQIKKQRELEQLIEAEALQPDTPDEQTEDFPPVL